MNKETTIAYAADPDDPEDFSVSIAAGGPGVSEGHRCVTGSGGNGGGDGGLWLLASAFGRPLLSALARIASSTVGKAASTLTFKVDPLLRCDGFRSFRLQCMAK